MFDRKLEFIVLGNKGTGKTTFVKLLKKSNRIEIDPTINIEQHSLKAKLDSSRNSSIFSIERWRKYKLKVIDVPGDFAFRRTWREAIKSMKRRKKLIFVVFFRARATIADNQSALEEVYNQYLESIDSKDIEKADLAAQKKPLLLLLVLNQQDGSKPISLEKYYKSHLNSIIEAIRRKIPLLAVERFEINVLAQPRPHYESNSILERMKRFIYYEN